MQVHGPVWCELGPCPVWPSWPAGIAPDISMPAMEAWAECGATGSSAPHPHRRPGTAEFAAKQTARPTPSTRRRIDIIRSEVCPGTETERKS